MIFLLQLKRGYEIFCVFKKGVKEKKIHILPPPPPGQIVIASLIIFDMYFQACECDPRGVERGNRPCDLATGQCR